MAGNHSGHKNIDSIKLYMATGSLLSRDLNKV